MPKIIKAKTALISVFNKDGLKPIVEKLNNLGINIISTGGTALYIKKLGIDVMNVEELTSYPSILGGRVKTLHPKIFGGILNRKNNRDDEDEILKYQIPKIDIVIVDLYPFQETVDSGASINDIIEKIDIGGIALIRAAAKNYESVVCVSNSNMYLTLLNLLSKNKGKFNIEERKRFSAKAFEISSSYDFLIHSYLSNKGFLKIYSDQELKLRYGENPHQAGFFYGNFDSIFKKHSGKNLSYNNLLDIDAALNLIKDFENEPPTFAILKHNNTCGIATRNQIEDAYEAALSSDPISAFGGILVSNTIINEKTAKLINNLFCEVVIAKKYDKKSLKILSKKEKRIILELKKIDRPKKIVRTCLNGFLVQEQDNIMDNENHLKFVTKKIPSKNEIQDLIFASKIAKHTKSNTIVLAKNKHLISSGTGQTSRVDALKQAIMKAKDFGFSLKNAVMASDAFFPFPDCVEIAEKAGIVSIIQPGGSIKDELSINLCNEKNISMVFTGYRHFKH